MSPLIVPGRQRGATIATLVPEQVRKSLDLARNSARWSETDTDRLIGHVFILAVHLGVWHTEDIFEEVRPFYRHVAERTTLEDRLGLVMRLSELCEKFEAGLASLVPFVCADEEPEVISTAALNLCVLIPPRHGDILTGPKDVLGFLEDVDSDISRSAILQGVLMLGDRRVLPLLSRCWEGLGREGRKVLAHSWSGLVFASTVDFLLDWFEGTEDENDHGCIAAALASYPRREKLLPLVVDIERKFPANGESDGPLMQCVGQWSFEEYGKIIAPRLKAIAKAETGHRVIPQVLAAWGISHTGQLA